MKDLNLNIENKYNKSFIGLMEKCKDGEWCKTEEATRKFYIAKLRLHHLESDLKEADEEIGSYKKMISVLTYICEFKIFKIMKLIIKMYFIL